LACFGVPGKTPAGRDERRETRGDRETALQLERRREALARQETGRDQLFADAPSTDALSVERRAEVGVRDLARRDENLAESQLDALRGVAAPRDSSECRVLHRARHRFTRSF
ncbi:MAG TPA: hypothetical protein VM692_12650, partial [Gammaproteobacteria bacterium]|nr:hypothetical protein [Gammaproteobacteria bacterium]